MCGLNSNFSDDIIIMAGGIKNKETCAAQVRGGGLCADKSKAPMARIGSERKGMIK